MDDYKKLKALRARDAVKLDGAAQIREALQSYKDKQKRYPTTLLELRTSGSLPATALSDLLFKQFLYNGYLKPDDFSKNNKCTVKSKICRAYQLGVNLEDLANPSLENDSDVDADIRGNDAKGCSGESALACYDVVFSDSNSTSTAPSAR